MLAALGLLAVLALGLWAGALLRGGDDAAIRAALSVAETLGAADTAGYARAVEPRPFRFPEDHGPHPDFRNEWWYFTGNLEAEDGRRFGYQLTFFRGAVAPDMPERASEWATRQVYMAHLALTDARAGEFHEFDRFARAALGLAGAEAEPFRVWVEEWTAEALFASSAPSAVQKGSGGEGSPLSERAALGSGGGRSPLSEREVFESERESARRSGAAEMFPLRLRAAEGDVAIDLVLERGKPPVLQGERGLSPKGPEPGNASYYYSYTRMPSEGEVWVGDEVFRVRGASWMDREWSTSALSGDLVGWDWFALQLDDGRELMYYQLRRENGEPGPFSGGTLVAPDGVATRLAREDVRLEVLDTWRSPADGTRYPARWRLRVPSAGLELGVEPVVADQELRDIAFRYWEGAVDVRGRSGGRAVSGRGYVELTGYAGGGAGGSARPEPER